MKFAGNANALASNSGRVCHPDRQRGATTAKLTKSGSRFTGTLAVGASPAYGAQVVLIQERNDVLAVQNWVPTGSNGVATPSATMKNPTSGSIFGIWWLGSPTLTAAVGLMR